MPFNYLQKIGQCTIIFSAATLIFYSPCGLAKYKPRHNYKGEQIKVCKTQDCEPFRFLATVTGGAGFLRAGQSSDFTNNAITYTYEPNSGAQTTVLWGASVGEEFRFHPTLVMDLTIGYYQIGTFKATGTVTQNATTYDYQYSVNSKQYLLETKFLTDMSSGVHPYLSLGIGAAFNMLGNYAVTPATAVDTPLYSTNTNYNFAYSVGIGFDFNLNAHARLGFGYRFVGLGPAQLGAGAIDAMPISNTIGQDALNVQEVIAQLTLIA